jgi:hypothetical protein
LLLGEPKRDRLAILSTKRASNPVLASLRHTLLRTPKSMLIPAVRWEGRPGELGQDRRDDDYHGQAVE